MRDRLLETLNLGGSVEVAVVLEAFFDDEPLDLTTRPGRLLIENAVLVDLARADFAIENL
jgi:hypothetical protein